MSKSRVSKGLVATSKNRSTARARTARCQSSGQKRGWWRPDRPRRRSRAGTQKEPLRYQCELITMQWSTNASAQSQAKAMAGAPFSKCLRSTKLDLEIPPLENGGATKSRWKLQMHKDTACPLQFDTLDLVVVFLAYSIGLMWFEGFWTWKKWNCNDHEHMKPHVLECWELRITLSSCHVSTYNSTQLRWRPHALQTTTFVGLCTSSWSCWSRSIVLEAHGNPGNATEWLEPDFGLNGLKEPFQKIEKWT